MSDYTYFCSKVWKTYPDPHRTVLADHMLWSGVWTQEKQWSRAVGRRDHRPVYTDNHWSPPAQISSDCQHENMWKLFSTRYLLFKQTSIRQWRKLLNTFKTLWSVNQNKFRWVLTQVTSASFIYQQSENNLDQINFYKRVKFNKINRV